MLHRATLTIENYLYLECKFHFVGRCSMLQLKDKVAVITGASQGIGLCLAEQLLAEGCYVAVWGRSRPSLSSEQLYFIPTDVGKESDVTAAWQATAKWAPSAVRFLINNAGIGTYGPVESCDSETWDRLFRTNIYAAFFCTRALIPHMKANGGGHIVQVGSVAGLRGVSNMSAYCATKFALRGFSESLMTELRDHEIKVSYLAPGGVETRFFDALQGFQPGTNLMQPEDVASTVVEILRSSPNYLPACIEVRPLRPTKK